MVGRAGSSDAKYPDSKAREVRKLYSRWKRSVNETSAIYDQEISRAIAGKCRLDRWPHADDSIRGLGDPRAQDPGPRRPRRRHGRHVLVLRGRRNVTSGRQSLPNRTKSLL